MSAVLSAILGLYLGHAQNVDAVSVQLARQEMQRLLAPAQIELVRDQTGRDVSQIVVVSFDGSCSLDSLPAGPSRTADTTALAETAVSSNHVLPYVRVNCAQVIRTLAPALQPLSMPLRRAIFGRALGRIMAHEIYHIVSQRKDHEQTGVAKASFALKDLTAPQFDFEFPTVAQNKF